MSKGTLGVIVTNRNFFADSLVVEGRKSILATLKKLDIDPIIVDLDTTPLGAVETLTDSQKCADLFRTNYKKIEGILVSLPNFGNEKGVADAIRMANLNVPVLIQAFPDTIKELTVAGRRDSFCGKLSVTNVLDQYGIPFSLTQKHCIDPASSEFAAELEHFLAVCRVVKGLRNARLGAIGARPNAFQTVRYSEKLLDDAGINVSTADLSEMFGAARKLADDDPRVTAKIEEIRDYGKADKVPVASLLRMAKLALVISDWIAANQVNATAIQCWDSVELNYGIMTCTLMSMMSEKLLPSACETDVMGALSMYALTLASQKPSALMDWNNNFEDDPDKCLLFHCGNWPKDMLDSAEIISGEILGTTLGAENAWGAIHGRVKPGPFTYARLHTDDRNGIIKAYVGEGKFTNDKLSPMYGGSAVVQVPGLQKLLYYICKEGFPHHGAMNANYVASPLAEAFETYFGWDTYYHQG